MCIRDREYNGSQISTGINACGYTTLADYYSHLPGNMQPTPTGKAMLSTSSYVVPNWKQLTSIGPEALTKPHGMPSSCGGYFNIMAAYGRMPCNTKWELSPCSAPSPNVPSGSPS